ncbi:Efflux pump periplasmic linker BepF [Polaribacter huanghezhanensis]|uniref:efflux RND transporter periplasmic adaptor subunit n=1 Tax=Polaribacter huanghezhanensis TaxID=1354726 RepID=UPI0026485AE4|nr:efflux RND transporter periplasmic adaptor subunit [Polaribacter huanghezhanensis]WKD85533.1 Efflux pump periplasmic linker BepF [Polaribacter huanghezhanensis]
MKKQLYLLIFTTASLFLTSCGSDDKKEPVNNSPSIQVKVAKVATNDTNPFLTVSGKIQAVKSADLGTRMMGNVDKVYVNVGDKVSKGQLLISINNADLEAKKAQVTASITQAKVAFINAEKNYKRFQNLYESKSISQKEMDDVTANYQVTKAGLEAANQMRNEVDAQFAYSNITAPFTGVITSKNIENGDMATPGKPLISLENPNDFEVMAMVPETEISEIKKGIKVRVLVKSINRAIAGKVSEVSSSAKNTGGQYLVKINVQKTNAPILSGMFATVEFPTERKATSNMVLLPKEAIITNGQLSGVYTTSQSNTAVLRWLRLGKTYGNQVEVLSGLKPGETYIISAEGRLFNGVKIIPSSILPKGKEATSKKK